MDKIIVNVRTNSKYGLVNPDDVLIVGKDIDEQGAERWIDNGIATRVDLVKEIPQAPTKSNTVDEIKSYLDDQGIEYSSTDKKQDLLDKCI